MSNTETDNTLLLKDVPQEISSEVRQYLEPFCLSVEKLQDVSNRLLEAMKEGLDDQKHDDAPVKMLPTFITATPDGTEQGDFLAVDLGGTNLRVFHVKLLPEANNLKIKADTEKPISQEIKDGPGEELFDYIATLIRKIIESQDLKGKHVPLGFTFSFPCNQESIDKSILNEWVKGFKCSGVVGEDVAQLLKEAMKKKEIPVKSVTMVNDTAGIMMSCRYLYPNCDIGMIIGTGTNACYMEEMKNIKYMEGEDGQMCINTEWGGFGDDGALSDIRTEADKKVDENSNNSGVHIFEKMISGMYLGEIVGRVLLDLTQKKLLFKGKVPENLRDPTKFKSKYISKIEHEEKGLKYAMGLLDCDEVDARIVQFVCATISSRAAHLCAAAVASIVKRICENRQQECLTTTVGVDGAVYKNHPKISGKIKKMVHRLAPKCEIDFKEVKEGSGKGAAIVSAVVQRLALKSGN